MKKWITVALLLALVLSLAACTKDAEPTETPTTEAAATTEPKASDSTPVRPITSDTPLASGSGCQPSADDLAE